MYVCEDPIKGERRCKEDTTMNMTLRPGEALIWPGPTGAHDWQPMSFNRDTGLVYIPVIDVSAVWIDMLHNGGTMKYLDGFFTVQGIFPDDTYDAAALKKLYGPVPDMQAIKATRKVKPVRELLRAWDPVAQKTVWEHETSSGIRGYDGGSGRYFGS